MVSPSLGDTWECGQGVISHVPSYEYSAKSFVIVCSGAGSRSPRFSIDPDGSVSVMYGCDFYSPVINTPLLKIDGTNISVLYQSKAYMANYIMSGTLTTNVNITGNQIITGKKTRAGGINTKSQTCLALRI